MILASAFTVATVGALALPPAAAQGGIVALQWAKRMHGFGDPTPAATDRRDPPRRDRHPRPRRPRRRPAGPDGPARRGGGLHALEIRLPRRRGGPRRRGVPLATPLPAPPCAAAPRRRPRRPRHRRLRDPGALGGDGPGPRPPRRLARPARQRRGLGRLRRDRPPARGATRLLRLPRDHAAGPPAPLRRALPPRAPQALASDPDDFSRASDELSHLQWIGLRARRGRFDLPFITEVVLAEIAARLPEPRPPETVPFFRNDDEESLFVRLGGGPLSREAR